MFVLLMADRALLVRVHRRQMKPHVPRHDLEGVDKVAELALRRSVPGMLESTLIKLSCVVSEQV